MGGSRELSREEQQLRSRLEQTVRSAFYLAGQALEQIQTQKLYRSTHDNFESYCLDTFNFTRDYAYLKIGAARVYQNLLDNLPTNNLPSAFLPTKQGQLRPIVKAELRSVEQVLVWNNAVSMAVNRVPTSSVVAEAVRLYLRENQTPHNPFEVGEVCRIVARDVSSLKKYNGCWCMISELQDWECLVDTWETELVVPIENLESWGLDEEQHQQIFDIGVRMTSLYETGSLDDAAYWVLNGLAKLDRFYLSPVEEKLLRVLEQEYLDKSG
ncbi:conserved hypothetical protein [Hyella patelloides LEGE 07179]|uniref:Uncharacterized protein n=1 Tax=Hyella patelloides LEGE 07179 TaxID=945734 RepID=A0A563VKW0_9CYAN|nr:hypothetical protein [Hyella patelloides]VEP12096.1 conserved hypothetical protein [Hyella patelloides LEGE 07179]